MQENKIYVGKSRGPINIALIKYWGKENEELLIPLNNSLSLTLDTNEFYTETEVKIILLNKNIDEINLVINNEISKPNNRILTIIKKFKELKKIENKSIKIDINSYNTFPIASGCASSASSMSALVIAINKALELNLQESELSKLARIGSGSACRSIIGGIGEWIKGEKDDNSFAVQIYKEEYWDLKVKLIITSQNKKEISSTLGMKTTKESSELFKYRINYIVNSNLSKIKEALKNKDFNMLAEYTMKDSNNFHACCRDSYPTINYLSNESEYIIKCVCFLNKCFKKNICGYTFDAGSNAFIIYEAKNKNIIDEFFKLILNDDEKQFNNYIINLVIEKNENKESLLKEALELFKKKPNSNNFKKQINFDLGKGAYNV